MNSLKRKVANRDRRHKRVRSVVSGNATRPRLTVFVSLRNVTAQLIDDDSHNTIAYTTTVGKKNLPNNLTDRAKWVGEDIAKKAKAKNINKVAFDRGIKLYHGRVAALADSARQAGLEI